MEEKKGEQEPHARFLKQLALRKEGMEFREYQVAMAERVLKKGNSLVILPTALGKTFVAAMVIAKFIGEMRRGAREDRKVLFLVPTKPLALQQVQRLRQVLQVEENEVQVLSGETAPEKRQAVWEDANVKIVCATPQTAEFDLLAGRVSLERFCLLVFDEAHRAVKEHAYAFLAKEAAKRAIFLLGLTASPSSKKEVVSEICRNLNTQHIELKDEDDAEVKRYANPVRVNWIFVDLPAEFLEIKRKLEGLLKGILLELKGFGVLESAELKRHKRELLEARKKALDLSRQNPEGFRALSLQAKAMSVSHALDLLETEGVHPTLAFMRELRARKQKSRATKELLGDYQWKLAEEAGEALEKQGVEHPKFTRLKAIVMDAVQSGKSVIVFAHYRDTVEKIVKELNGFAGVKAAAMVGKSKEGMSQKKQAQVLREFKEKKNSVLVATSVAEEGIDIPAVDLVVFFEAVPSEIRSIQRRGRTGRARQGNVVVLITRGSKDEAFFWLAKHKEKKMKRMLRELKESLEKEFADPEKQGEVIAGNQTRMFDF